MGRDMTVTLKEETLLAKELYLKLKEKYMEYCEQNNTPPEPEVVDMGIYSEIDDPDKDEPEDNEELELRTTRKRRPNIKNWRELLLSVIPEDKFISIEDLVSTIEAKNIGLYTERNYLSVKLSKLLQDGLIGYGVRSGTYIRLRERKKS